jgi:cytochrome c peroxidase
VDIADDDSVVVSVNPGEDKLSVISVATDTVASTVSFPAGSQPVAVVMAADKTSAYVVLRKARKLVRVTGLNTLAPAQDPTFNIAVGSEPTGVALSPNGSLAVVAQFGETFASVVDTLTGAVTQVELGGVQRTVTISNNGDNLDADEFAYVPLFFGKGSGNPADEPTDAARTGVVQEISLASLTVHRTLFLNPIAVTGVKDGQGNDTGCSPNQLYSAVLAGQGTVHKLYVPNICASPKGPVFALTNVFAVVSVLDLDTGTEDTGPTGTAVLQTLVAAQSGGSTTASFVGDPVAMDFRNNTGIAYLLSRAGGMLQRMVYNDAAALPIQLGTPAGGFSQVGMTGEIPQGVVVGHTVTKAYVVNEVSHDVSVIDLALLSEKTPRVSTAALPTAGTDPDDIRLGKKFFFTGQGRWSKQGVSSCASCHPDGNADGMTWVFGAGPRQTIALDAMFDHANPGTDQRVLNWTGIFDEMHDFEGNVRGTQGGKGAITDSATDAPIDLAAGRSLDGVNTTRNDNLSGSTKQVVATLSAPNHTEWDKLNRWVQAGVHTNHAPTALDPSAVTRGRTLFEANNCTFCHAGPKWTVSQVPYVPSQAANGSAAFALPDGGTAAPTGFRTQAFSAGSLMHPVNTETLKVSVEVFGLPDGGALKVGPERIGCVVREVGTFDVGGLQELKADGTQGQGGKGFNPPSLLGLATSAPYLHNGALTDLHHLFEDTYAKHHQTFSSLFLTNGGAGGTDPSELGQVDDLVQFLLSIDETTAPEPVPSNANICGQY